MSEDATTTPSPSLPALIAAKEVFARSLSQALHEYRVSTGAIVTDVSVSLMTHTQNRVVDHSFLTDVRLRVALQVEGRPVELEV